MAMDGQVPRAHGCAGAAGQEEKLDAGSASAPSSAAKAGAVVGRRPSRASPPYGTNIISGLADSG